MKIRSALIQTCLFVAGFLQVFNSDAQPVTQVAAGSYHSLFLKSDGSLWAMGLNNFGQLGDGTNINTNRPEQIVASNVTAVAAGGEPPFPAAPLGDHSLFIKSDGSLWTMGDNYYGELGDGTYSNTNLPEQIVSSNVTAIAANSGHSLFLKSDGSLWAMGYNAFGQLGDGTYNKTNRPEQIVASNVTAIAAGAYHSLFLKSDGSLWAMGLNRYGQLGDGRPNIPFDPTFGTNRPQQIVASNVTAIAAGWYHSLFLKSDGSLWAMGYNAYGQLGDGKNTNTNRPEQIVASNITAIAGGYGHSLFLKSDGSLWGMGYNRYGQLGDGTFLTNSPFGTNVPEQIVAGGVTKMAGGVDGSLFIKNDGSLWAMGNNSYGELGDGTYNKTNLPEQIVVNPFYNQMTSQLLGTGGVRLSFTGIAGTNYALDAMDNLSPPDWQPVATNTAGTFGALVFTNTPDPATNHFWRVRLVP